MTIIIRSVFEEDGKLYRQVYLDDALYKLNSTESIFQKGLILMKQFFLKNVVFATIGILKILVLSMKSIFTMVVMI